MNEIRALLLAAGVGSRLKPLTNRWPKCLMPIGERPLLEYWLQALHMLGIDKVLINTHHHSEIILKFLSRPQFDGWVSATVEDRLLGTAGALMANKAFLSGGTVLLVHADNWCQCDLGKFIEFHLNKRPKSCPITMMTFNAVNPESCGILDVNSDGMVVGIHEKVKNPPGVLANAAIYLLEPEILEWLERHPMASDFSLDVLPSFIGRIAVWHNDGINRDIGTIEMLQAAQNDPKPLPIWGEDLWQSNFAKNPINEHVQNKKVN